MDLVLRQEAARLRLHALVVLLFLMSLLNGCTSTVRDGPPEFYVDEKRIPNATPKVEPLSRIGNKPSYTVFGKRYYVLKSSYGYDERGIASWYGTKFHSHHTSNGERYNMLSMTAAHKTLPLPTYVEVTNLRNHKKVVVKVNDRGPFESNRLIDLSYVAAKKLGMLGHGTTYVEVKSIDPRDLSRYREMMAKNNHTNKGLYIQIGAFKTRANAEHFRQQLTGSIAAPMRITRPQSLYRVEVGPIDNVANARRLQRQLKFMGVNSKQFSA